MMDGLSGRSRYRGGRIARCLEGEAPLAFPLPLRERVRVKVSLVDNALPHHDSELLNRHPQEIEEDVLIGLTQ